MRHVAMLGVMVLLGGVSAGAQGRGAGAPGEMPAGVQGSQLPDGSTLLMNAKGMTLYTFARDTPQQSNCNGGCAQQWPPLMAEAGAMPSGDWTIVTREDGSKQWAYKGKPLYAWIKDGKPGDLTGEGVANGAWKIAVTGGAPNLVKVYLAHIATAFQDTPSQQGLMVTAFAEAKTAAQHAALAAKSDGNLDAMKLHAGHVIHAVDPRIEPKGPGLNYGVKRAALGVVERIQQAARVPTASENVLTHSTHILVSANNVARRADEIVAAARQVQAATTAAEAAPHVAEMHLLAQQLTAGLDVNQDGQIGWQSGEGGLDQAQMHLQLLLKGEAR